MPNIFPIQKQQEYPVFGHFNDCYGETLIEYCPLLNQFQINILTVDEYSDFSADLPAIDGVESQPFSSFIRKDGEKADTSIAGIVICEPLIESIGFNETEQYAAIAHEIGHILYFFLDYKERYPGSQGEEIFSDTIATRIGLSAGMLSVIDKLERCGLYSDVLSRFGMRKVMLGGNADA